MSTNTVIITYWKPVPTSSINSRTIIEQNYNSHRVDLVTKSKTTNDHHKNQAMTEDIKKLYLPGLILSLSLYLLHKMARLFIFRPPPSSSLATSLCFPRSSAVSSPLSSSFSRAVLAAAISTFRLARGVNGGVPGQSQTVILVTTGDCYKQYKSQYLFVKKVFSSHQQGILIPPKIRAP